jgi:hypothetical protein
MRTLSDLDAQAVTPKQAVALIQKHGIVLESANGPIPCLVQIIVGGRIKGSWWAHPRGKEIFRITRAVRDSPQILACRLVAGKVTLVHERLWPALVRCADHFRADQIAKLVEEHSASGQHKASSIPFPAWVPPRISAVAHALSDEDALSAINAAVPGCASAA